MFFHPLAFRAERRLMQSAKSWEWLVNLLISPGAMSKVIFWEANSRRLWIIKNQASYLAAGDLSYLQYGRTLMKVPIGVFGMAIGVAAYPSVSRMVAADGIPQAYGVLAHAVRLMLFATFAAQICLTLAGFELTYLVWGLFASRFTIADAQATGTVLMFLCIGLAGLGGADRD